MLGFPVLVLAAVLVVVTLLNSIIGLSLGLVSVKVVKTHGFKL